MASQIQCRPSVGTVGLPSMGPASPPSLCPCGSPRAPHNGQLHEGPWLPSPTRSGVESTGLYAYYLLSSF